MFNEMLIQMVQDSPCIYDSRSRLYKNQKRKENVWQHIGWSTGHPVEKCMKRWRSLRDRFAKEKRKIENSQRSGAAAENLPVWKHYEALKFLQDHLRHKLTVGNNSSSPVIDFTQDETVAEEEGITLEVVDKNSDQSSPSSASEASTSRQGKKRKRSDQIDFQESICNMLRQNAENISKVTKASNIGQSNGFSNFGIFVASSLTSMPQAKAYESIAVISQHLASQHANWD